MRKRGSIAMSYKSVMVVNHTILPSISLITTFTLQSMPMAVLWVQNLEGPGADAGFQKGRAGRAKFLTISEIGRLNYSIRYFLPPFRQSGLWGEYALSFMAISNK